MTLALPGHIRNGSVSSSGTQAFAAQYHVQRTWLADVAWTADARLISPRMAYVEVFMRSTIVQRFRTYSTTLAALRRRIPDTVVWA